MTDNSKITFGIYKGCKLKNVPAEYLLNIYNVYGKKIDLTAYGRKTIGKWMWQMERQELMNYIKKNKKQIIERWDINTK